MRGFFWAGSLMSRNALPSILVWLTVDDKTGYLPSSGGAKRVGECP